MEEKEKLLVEKEQKLNDKIDQYRWFVGILISLIAISFSIIAFLGRKYIVDGVKKIIESKTGHEVELFLASQSTKDIIENTTQEKIKELIKVKLQEMEELSEDYKKDLNILRDSIQNFHEKTLPEITKETLKKFEEKLSRLKEEKEYSAEDWFYKGLKKKVLKDYDGAVKDYTKAIKLDDKYAKLYNSRGIVYKNLKDYEKAVDDYDKAIELDNKYAKAYNNRASTFWRLKQYDKAIADYTKAIELDDKKPSAYQNLCEIQIVINNYYAAYKTIQKALSFAKDNKDLLISYYLKSLVERLLDKDTSDSEMKLNALLQEDIDITWNFDAFEDWLQQADIPDDKKTFIQAKTALLKSKANTDQASA